MNLLVLLVIFGSTLAISERTQKMSMCLYTVYKIPQYLPVQDVSYSMIYRNESQTLLVDLRRRHDDCMEYIALEVYQLLIYVVLAMWFIMFLRYPLP